MLLGVLSPSQILNNSQKESTKEKQQERRKEYRIKHQYNKSSTNCNSNNFYIYFSDWLPSWSTPEMGAKLDKKDAHEKFNMNTTQSSEYQY